jgi:hypothetical protein
VASEDIFFSAAVAAADMVEQAVDMGLYFFLGFKGGFLFYARV